MTTIVADHEGMAADTLTVVGEIGYHATKMKVINGAILAGAGDAAAIDRFFKWWPKRKTAKLKMKKSWDFQGLVLSKEGLFCYGETGDADKVSDPYMAIGSGSGIALGAMDMMVKLGHPPDVILAVEVACERSPQSDAPIEYLSLKDLRKRK